MRRHVAGLAGTAGASWTRLGRALLPGLADSMLFDTDFTFAAAAGS